MFFYAGGTIGHTGIVTEVSDSSITVVEGNSSDRVQKLSYSRSSASIAGYGHPWYEKAESTEPVIESQTEDWCGNPPFPASQTVVVHLPLLKHGASGKPVESAQALLIHRGYYCGGKRNLFGRETPDGEFGPATEKAVRSFQAKTALDITTRGERVTNPCLPDPDGEIGADTWTALLTAY